MPRHSRPQPRGISWEEKAASHVERTVKRRGVIFREMKRLGMEWPLPGSGYLARKAIAENLRAMEIPLSVVTDLLCQPPGTPYA